MHPARPLGALLKKAARIGREKAHATVHRKALSEHGEPRFDGARSVHPPHVRLLSPSRLRVRLRFDERRLGALRLLGVYFCGVAYVAAGALSYALWRLRLWSAAQVEVGSAGLNR
jgi:hypothetical protein